jgi:hypothetical protein
MGREGMTKRVARGGFLDTDGEDGTANGPLDGGVVAEVAPFLAGFAVGVDARGGEDELPLRIAGGVGVLPRKSVRQIDVARSGDRARAADTHSGGRRQR